MFAGIQSQILALMLVPPEPHPPEGSPESVKIFRAGRNYFRFRMILWASANACLLLFLSGTMLILERPIRRQEPWLQLTWHSLEALIGVAFLGMLIVTYLEQRLNFELRWYIVTDRSLRVRNGIWSTHELTTTFANIQEIRVSAGPLQKLLGLADVEVHSAGGAVAGPHGISGGHVARFEGLDNANEIRDHLVERLRQYRDSGLGEAPREDLGPSRSVAAAQAVLDEVRLLRASLS
jgi:membrane protein YdbS with pleckstrin-like domain